MNTQTEAERLADEMERGQFTLTLKPAAAELRRLQSFNNDLMDQNNELEVELALLEQANQEMLEALKLADALLCGANMNALIVERKVKAAIAKHSKEQ
jgi:hypothetical protein